MEKRQLYRGIASSQDPSVVANKIKGVILSLSSLIIMFGAIAFHITLSAGDVISLATEVSGVVGSVWAIYGGILHLVTWVGTVRSQV